MRSATASQAQKRTQTGASPNTYLHALYFNQFFWDSVFSNLQSTQGVLENNQRTTREHKEQGKCSSIALVQLFKIHVSTSFSYSQLVYRKV
jgi:hypothetical protein